MNYSELISTSLVKDGWIIAAYTDKYIVDKWPMKNESQKNDVISSESKALEIRIFDKDRELKLWRSEIGKDFYYRERTDKETDDYYDEVQFLDIDTKEKSEGEDAKNCTSS